MEPWLQIQDVRKRTVRITKKKLYNSLCWPKGRRKQWNATGLSNKTQLSQRRHLEHQEQHNQAQPSGPWDCSNGWRFAIRPEYHWHYRQCNLPPQQQCLGARHLSRHYYRTGSMKPPWIRSPFYQLTLFQRRDPKCLSTASSLASCQHVSLHTTETFF
jgi:hypothetical protein